MAGHRKSKMGVRVGGDLTVSRDVATMIAATGREPLTNEQLVEIITEIRDNSFRWWLDLSRERDPRGIGAAIMAAKAIEDEFDRRERRAAGLTNLITDVRCNGIRLEDLQFGSNLKRESREGVN